MLTLDFCGPLDLRWTVDDIKLGPHVSKISFKESHIPKLKEYLFNVYEYEILGPKPSKQIEKELNYATALYEIWHLDESQKTDNNKSLFFLPKLRENMATQYGFEKLPGIVAECGDSVLKKKNLESEHLNIRLRSICDEYNQFQLDITGLKVYILITKQQTKTCILIKIKMKQNFSNNVLKTGSVCLDSNFFQSKWSEDDFIEKGWIFELPTEIPLFYFIPNNQYETSGLHDAAIADNKFYHRRRYISAYEDCECYEIRYSNIIAFKE